MRKLVIGVIAVTAVACGRAERAESEPGPSAEPSAGRADDRVQRDDQGKASGEPCGMKSYEVAKDARSPHVPNDDVEYIDTLVPHHRLAIQMAELEVSRGARPELKAMAARMKAEQQREVEQMLALRQSLTRCREVPPLPDPHMEAKLAEMRKLSGAELDRAFVETMIPHHASGIHLNHAALPHLSNPDLDALSRRGLEQQSRELSELQMKKTSVWETP